MALMRRRPLLRAAAIGGGAYYAGKRRMESRQRQYEEHARIDKLRQLELMHEQGVLTDEEFAGQKANTLGA